MDYIKRCLADVMDPDFDHLDNQDMNDDEFGCAVEPNEMFLVGGGDLRMRKASGTGFTTTNTSSGAAPAAAPMGNRLYLPLPGSSDWNISDMSAWISIIPSMRIETIVRAHSPVLASELCRAIISRNDMSGGGPPKKSNNNGMNQFCLAKVVQFDSSLNETAVAHLLNELGAVAKTEHKNLLSIRKLHCGPMPAATAGGAESSMLCLAFEQCTTSLYQAIVDGYRNGNELAVRGLARKLNPHNGTTTTTAIQRMSDMISGVQRLHFMGISHMRLCPTNILIDNESTFKIGDFLGKFGLLGVGSTGTDNEKYMATVLAWNPSEVISDITKTGMISAGTGGSLSGDVFSLACCIFYSLTGQHPYGTFASGDRLAAGGGFTPQSSPSGPLFINGGTAEVIDNIHSDYIANQHLLYNCPLVLDLCMRCLCLNSAVRLDISGMSRHPIFWDFDFLKGFILSAPIGDEVFREFCDYELLWTEIVAADIEFSSQNNSLGGLIGKYNNTVISLIEFLIEAWNSSSSVRQRGVSMAPISALWLKFFDRFPHVLVRAWDGVKIAGAASSNKSTITKEKIREIFSRNHLHWMMLRSSAVTSISHNFVREYYHCLNAILGESPSSLTFPDESSGLSDACASYSASVVKSIRSSSSIIRTTPPSVGIKYMAASPVIMPRSSPSMWPAVSAAVPPPPAAGTPGMKFLDPLIVKQMAAASAALTAVYENPELVSAINSNDPNVHPNPHSQLVAAATIYASLLQQGSESAPSAAAGAATTSIW